MKMQAAKCWGNVSCVCFGEVQHGEFKSGQTTNPGEVFERKVCNSLVEGFIFMGGSDVEPWHLCFGQCQSPMLRTKCHTSLKMVDM